MAERIAAGFKACAVVVADDVFGYGMSFISVYAQKMVESFILFGMTRNLESWEHIVDICGNENGIDHHIFCRTRMYIFAIDLKFCFACIEVLILDLAFAVPVQRIGNLRVKSIKIKMCSAAATFFVRCKCDTDLSVRNLFCDQDLKKLHDLSNTGFVVNSEDGISIGSDECTSL